MEDDERAPKKSEAQARVPACGATCRSQFVIFLLEKLTDLKIEPSTDLASKLTAPAPTELIVQLTVLEVLVPPATSAKPLQFCAETVISLSSKLPVIVNCVGCPYFS